MPDAPGLTATECEFRHPHGSFPVRCHQLTGEDLAHQLLGAEESYITVAVERLVEDALPLILRLVALGERLTNGIATLSQLQRESMRLELCRVHDALLDRGYGVLVGTMDRAVIREREIRRWTDYARVIGVVIHDTGEVEATIILPEGEVLERDEDTAPARAVERETIPPLRTMCHPETPAACRSRRLPIQRRPRSGPNDTSPTRSPPCDDVSPSPSRGASFDVHAATRPAEPMNINRRL